MPGGPHQLVGRYNGWYPCTTLKAADGEATFWFDSFNGTTYDRRGLCGFVGPDVTSTISISAPSSGSASAPNDSGCSAGNNSGSVAELKRQQRQVVNAYEEGIDGVSPVQHSQSHTSRANRVRQLDL
ncbi:hypothetical protein DFH08DRAFT_960593 [Mycena albidolilacea]|uniref:Uncharacterized protein n=1 Tax=Mycena albidolilacea TaxID=1033008 RepID=A0AAD7EQF4_9AGAR|nr:hypothetical protein DFH08DRAFT_960593 [Mycena albidolilacea]